MSEAIDIKTVPSLEGFFYSDKFIALVMGPVGSTKTTAGIQKILYHAARMAPCTDGIKRSRAIWVRQTREQLRDTSIPDFLKWFPDGKYGVFLKSEYRYILKIGNIECDVLFRGLDDTNDIRRLLSLQASFAIFEEFRELNPDIFTAMQARLGRYPDGMLVPHRPEWGLDNGGNPVQGCVTEEGKSNRHVWGMSNPPDADTFWEDFISTPPDNAEVFIQPSGLSPEADWVHLLPADYYTDLAVGKTEEYIDVYIHAKFGQSLSGKPVFRCFDKSQHVAKSTLLVQGSPLIIGVDAGLNPTAVITQQTYDGRVMVLDAMTGSEGGMGALRFIRERLKPLLANKYPGRPVTVVIDPAAFQRAQTDERSVADIFKAEGFQVRPARTNSIAARIAAGEQFMTRTVNSKPALLVDPGATLLIKALAGKYRYKLNTKGELDDKPEKSHPWSDVCFVAGTPVLTPRGSVAVETLRLGDAVAVPDGVDYVTAVGSANAHQLVRVDLSDGSSLVCTPDHPFILSNTCVLPADALYSDCELYSVEDGVWASGQWRTRRSGRSFVVVSSAVASLRLRLGAWLRAKANSAQERATNFIVAMLTGWSSMGCGSPGLVRTSTTGISGLTNALYLCTDAYGSTTTAQFQTRTTYTISTVTQPTMTSVTLSVSSLPSTSAPMSWNDISVGKCKSQSRLGKLLSRGISLLKGESGTANTPSKLPLTVKRVVSLSGGRSVYNLTTARTHVYYAGGALVHNCDAFTYACLQHDNGATFGSVVSSQRREIKPAPRRWAA